VRDQNGAPVANYTCQWTFDDFGSPVTSDACAGEKLFADAPAEHSATVVVRDSTTGAVTTVTAPTVLAIEELYIDTFGDSNACLELSYSTNRQYGYGAATYSVDIQPAANVLSPAPWAEDESGIQVSAPGVYRVQVTAVSNPPGRICVAESAATITVADCP
jgi:hypothetical protein